MSTTIGIAIVRWNHKYLVGTRSENAVLGGFDEFPGGKCEPNESPADCAVRECLEESGLLVHVSQTLAHKRHTYEHGTLDLHFFLCEPDSNEPAVPGGNFQWISTSELAACRFPPANAEIVQGLIENNK